MSVKGLMISIPERLTQSTMVEAACRVMDREKLGAVAVIDDGRVCGIFTYRDLVERVILERRRPEATPLGEVMTRKVECTKTDDSYGRALRQMIERDYTYLPVVFDDGGFAGMLSVRMLLDHHIDHLATELDSVAQYIAVDGPGGG